MIGMFSFFEYALRLNQRMNSHDVLEETFVVIHPKQVTDGFHQK